MSTALRVSEAASIAMHTMGVLGADPDTAMTAGQIASRLNVSHAHLSKVLQRLGRAGLLNSVRGPGGGFRLARPAGEITLLSVYEAVEGPLSLTDCLLGDRRCKGGKCIFGGLLASVNRQFEQYLRKTRVTDLVQALGGAT
jgi:Rrf2 family protein